MIKLTVLIIFLLFIPFSCFGQHSVTLNWTASIDATGNPSLTYNIYKLNGACPSSGAVGFVKLTSGVSGTSFIDTSVSIGNTYCYYATSSVNGLESTPSNTVSAVILPAPPAMLQVKIQ